MEPLEEIRLDQRGDLVLAGIKGELDLSNVPAVRDQLLHAVPNTARALVLDLSETAYLDSSGIRLIFELSNRLRNRGQDLRVVVPDDSIVRRILMITEVHQVVPLSA